MTKKSRKWLRIVGMIVTILIITGAGTYLTLNRPVPKGVAGPEADEMAQKVLEAIAYENWENTGAISWDFAGRHQFVWDKKRHFVQVVWGEYKVLLDINKKAGFAFKNNNPVTGKAQSELIDKAYTYWANDSFWLNAPAKVFDGGTTRQVVETQEGKALLVSYASGGVTPGDSYLWFLDGKGQPTYFRMWVSIIPIGGVKATWDSWTTTATGAKLATAHDLGFLNVKIENIKTAETLQELTGGIDLFKDL